MYKLAATLNAHSSDVRAVVSPLDTLVLSASRDCTAVSWAKASTSTQFAPDGVYAASSRYVNSIAYIPPSSEAPKGYVITGGQDAIINVYALQPGRPDPLYTLLGHSENVCSLSTAQDGTIISGSWDKTARVWRNWQPLYELKGHSQSVWTVLPVEKELFLTGSADKSIRLWDHHKVIQTYTGHNDAVRGLALVPDIGFASCSNDSEIRVWTMGGDIVYTLTGHTSFVYSLSVLPNGDIVSGGEDRSVRIWRDGECTQTIIHPAISVWTVSTMPNGDIVSGCSDGVVRIFSVSEDRWATAADLATYEEQVASQALPSQQVGDVRKSDLPGSEALSIPGKKPGEVKMIRVNDKVEAHQWDSASSSWQKIGEVVDAVGSGRRQLYEGKEYDYVFDVDIQEGVPPLKLPYNVTENTFTAAQRFLNANDLPMSYLDQVANFIEKNTAGVEMTSGNEYVDPFTGASRYRSSTSSVPMSSNQSGLSSDPFTGGSRYTPNTPAPTAPPASPPVEAKTTTFVPATDLSLFTSAEADRIKRKIEEGYELVRNEILAVQVNLHPEDFNSLEEICQYATQVRKGVPVHEHPTFVELRSILRFLETFPESERLPILDLMKLIARYCPHTYSEPKNAATLSTALLDAVSWAEAWEVPLSQSRSSGVQLCLRALANMMAMYPSPNDLNWVPTLFDRLRQAPYAALKATHRVALGTIVFNLSSLCLRNDVSPPTPVFDAQLRLALHILTQIPEIEDDKKGQRDGVYRALYGLGNSLFTFKTANGPIGSDLALTIRGAVNSVKSAYSNDNEIKKASTDILGLV